VTKTNRVAAPTPATLSHATRPPGRDPDHQTMRTYRYFAGALGLSQNPHLEITNLALSWTQSWCAVRANPHLQPARMRGQSFHVGVRHCNHAPSLMSGPAICQSFIISVVGRSGEMELGWRSRSAGEGWAGSSCRRDSQRFSPLGTYQSSG
jgi:hypothetical protein